jgi:heterotetrameric sarcosine oxidase delta subunit
VALKIPCPTCGLRPYTEFTFGGERHTIDPTDIETDFRRVYLLANAGVQPERWYHAFGCRRWFEIERDVDTNEVR